MLRSLSTRFARALARVVPAALVCVSATAYADYPDRPVTLVVPFPTGGNSDIVGRQIAEKISTKLGQPVIVENRTGAGGMVGNQAVARAKPDGYTMLLGGMSTQVLLAGTAPELPYDPVNSFSSVALISKVPLVLVVPATSPATDLKSFAEYLKKSPGKYNFSSAGTGTSGHITSQYFANAIGADVVHVPYRGSSPALVDLVEGRNAYLVDTPPVVKELVKGGKIRALAVFSENRLEELPDVPTVAEAGMADVVKHMLQPWQGIFVPAGTPPEVEAKIHDAVNSAVSDPEFQAKLRQLGLIPMPGTLADAKQLFEVDYANWLPILDNMGLKPKS
ncbi:tripartite tricarboxylate transporter substrate binding protein BugE [Bordetella sp. 02P26C-1]|uniref:tripartite tricarboxylate transporter substrate binding protein BugE n=1 Tax=Bordetella sp. 02P26C-1 TaxID=2683195 RepID=UPI00135338F6|nr:tripartite tricarboxylate transporter substrate binding protein BugE [Bordetella sp. 02P26C-1]MVW79530.1 tripartite tricarboxylate transporter substrate binding protein BugE [Bordetella sp. 02P26C-1]